MFDTNTLTMMFSIASRGGLCSPPVGPSNIDVDPLWDNRLRPRDFLLMGLCHVPSLLILLVSGWLELA